MFDLIAVFNQFQFIVSVDLRIPSKGFNIFDFGTKIQHIHKITRVDDQSLHLP